MKKIKKYVKEIVFLGIALFIVSNLVSFYKASNVKVSDGVCEGGADIVHFFATWCPVCKVEAPNINQVAKDFFVVGVAVKSLDIEEYMEKNNYTFAFIEDKDGAIAKEADIQVFPTTITCKDKKVLWVDVGYTSTLGLYLRAFLARL